MFEKCSDECKADFARYAEEIVAFGKRFPNHCTDCRGWGLHVSTYDPSPAGISLGHGYMSDVDICETCRGTCPCCREPLPVDVDDSPDHMKCVACGSTVGQDGLSDGPECLCWMNESEEYHGT